MNKKEFIEQVTKWMDENIVDYSNVLISIDVDKVNCARTCTESMKLESKIEGD